MKKILGLDLGTTSIGWAFIHEIEGVQEKSSIIKSGVRIVPLTTEEKDEFSKGNALSTNSTRTQKRGARRNYQRFVQRRDKLITLLKEIRFISDVNDLLNTNTLELYERRAKAVSSRIEKRDLAKVLFLLNGKRGYKSNRKTNDEDSDSEYLVRISERDKELLERNITIGQKFYELLQKNPFARLKNRVYSRKSYVNEFDAIWKEQSKHYPELTEELKKLVRDQIIFYQRDLRSQKRLLSKCEFEKHHKVIPVSSPLFQEFRLWQRLHDIVIKDKFSQEYVLTQEQKEALFDVLQEVPKLTSDNVLRFLGLHTKEYTINFDKIDGNTTGSELLEIFNNTDYDTVDILDLNIYEEGNLFDKQPIMQLWHLIYSAKDDQNLIKNLQQKFSFNKEQATQIAKKVHYKLNYGSLSSKAIRKILPYMQRGFNYHEACLKAGYRHSSWITKEENENRDLENKLESVKKNSLRNPVVEKILNQLVNLINAILEDDAMGRPDEIRIEMARKLRMNAKKRKELTKQIVYNAKRHENIRKVLKAEFGIARPSRNDIIKYKLAEETNWISLYSGNSIKPSELFTPSYDIEHIIPKSRMFDDSFTNKTICEAELNREKGNQTAYDYMQSRGEENLNRFLNEVKNNKKIYKPKREKLLMSSETIPDDFINRQINETQYITKKAKELLLSICRNVAVTTGSITDLLKEQWQLKHLLQELNLEKYQNLGQTEFRNIKTNGNQSKRIEQIFHIDKAGNKTLWSKRDDHRHHALDAIVVALTKPKHIQHLNRLNATFEDRYQQGDDQLKIAAQSFELPWKGLRNDVAKSLKETLISFKQKNKVITKNINKTTTKVKDVKKYQVTLTPRGQLHEETVYGKIKRVQETPVVLNGKFDLQMTKCIVNIEIKHLIESHLEKFDNNPKKAFSSKSLKLHPIVYKGTTLSEVQCFEDIYVIRKPVDDKLNLEQVIDKKVQAILTQRLSQFENKKTAFSNLEENPIYLNKNKNIQIKRVKIKARYSDLVDIGRGYVNLGNNHHIAIYKDSSGKIHGEKVSFFEAVERVNQKQSIVKKRHEEGWTYLYNIQINDYFVFFDDCLTADIDLLDENNYHLIASRLWKVQALSILGSGTPYLEFTYQYATKLDKDSMVNYKRITTYSKLIGKCQKVQINSLGRIVKIGEY